MSNGNTHAAPGSSVPVIDQAVAPSPAVALGQLRRQALFTIFFRSTALAALVTAVTSLFVDQVVLLVFVALVTWLIGMSFGLMRPGYRNLDKARFARHLDRCFAEFEESAGLMVLPPDRLTTLQKLQRQRIAPHWSAMLAQRQRWLPGLRWRAPLLGLLVALLILLSGHALNSRLDGAAANMSGTASMAPGATQASRPELITITVTPPAYTGLPEWQQQTFDLEVPEGSLVSWSLQWPDAAQPLMLLNDGQEQRIAPQQEDQRSVVTFSHKALRTGLYRFTQSLQAATGDGASDGSDFHTLAVQLDSPPVLRILEPSRSTLELPREGSPRFSSQVQVRDDFGVAMAEIRASVAKGSGEGVKFRDEIFQFDSSTIEEDSIIYTLDWSLEQLGMEPGDEVYFFAVARDNRQPEANEARSDTVVVRWLDEEQPLQLTDGLAINVMPEYYRSQRQIIIETEQLIADRDALERAEFDSTSRELAQAQSELKERYGQYLGDENNEGGAPFSVPEEGQDQNGEDQNGEDHSDHDHAGDDHTGHDHAGDDHGASDQIDTQGSADELIARFMHNHGAADIGRITRRNPVGLMKRSISNMWQSELHLHLSEPEKALPFAYEALKYLDLARQADRIYTRRLGFEPPPVTEERRLSGELEDIVSRERRQSPQPDPDAQLMAGELFSQLGALRTDQPIPTPTRDLLRRMADHLTALSQQRPALIRQAANVERLLLADRSNPEGCDDCLSGLLKTSWSLAGNTGAEPDRRSNRPATTSTSGSPAQAYQEALRQIRAEQNRP